MGYTELIMNRKMLVGLGVLILACVALFLSMKDGDKLPLSNEEAAAFDPKNAAYEIDGRKVELVGGVSEAEAAPGSASKVVVRYFGNEAKGDLNGDGEEDRAFLITEEGGGSGLFYYAVVALKTPTGYKMTNAFLIGERIVPQSTNIIAQELHVNYAERKPNEPMTARPSVGAVKLLKVTQEGVLEGLMK